MNSDPLASMFLNLGPLLEAYHPPHSPFSPDIDKLISDLADEAGPVIGQRKTCGSEDELGAYTKSLSFSPEEKNRELSVRFTPSTPFLEQKEAPSTLLDTLIAYLQSNVDTLANRNVRNTLHSTIDEYLIQNYFVELPAFDGSMLIRLRSLLESEKVNLKEVEELKRILNELICLLESLSFPPSPPRRNSDLSPKIYFKG